MRLKADLGPAECFNPALKLRECAERHNWQYYSTSGDYELGYGPMEVTAEMCTSKWHVRAIDCARKEARLSCRNSRVSELARSMWDFTFDPVPYSKAADYLCSPHNLRIFLNNQDHCLKKQKIDAQHCREEQSIMSEALNEVKHSRQLSDAEQQGYEDYLKRILNRYKCKRMNKKLRCLFNVLYRSCPPEVVILIINYFKELMSDDNCDFRQMDEEQRKRLLSQKEFVSTMTTKEDETRLITNSGQKTSRGSREQTASKNLPNISPHPSYHVSILFVALIFITLSRTCL